MKTTIEKPKVKKHDFAEADRSALASLNYGIVALVICLLLVFICCTDWSFPVRFVLAILVSGILIGALFLTHYFMQKSDYQSTYNSGSAITDKE